jgi:hypothetical protein
MSKFRQVLKLHCRATSMIFLQQNYWISGVGQKLKPSFIELLFLCLAMNFLLFQQLKPLSILLESTIAKIWEEYMLKTIDENNRKPIGDDATIIRNVRYLDTVL